MIRIIVALACLIPFVAQSAESPEPVQQVTTFDTFELPDWFKVSFLDLSEDNAEAIEVNKHLVVFFWQDFCGYCKNTIEKNLTQQSIRDVFDEHFDVVALNIWGSKEVYGLDGTATTEKEIARSLGVQFTPTIIFFNADGKPVLRLNGYVSPTEMQVALNYVQNKTYESQTIFEYLAANQPRSANARLNTQPFIQDEKNLNVKERPRAVLFEQTSCPDCDTFHRCVLSLDSVRERFEPFHTVQLDMWSTSPVTTTSGEKKTARDYARDMKIMYAPSLVLFDSAGFEIIRVESQLRSFHTEAVLEYIADGIYKREPNFQRYIEERGDIIRAKGEHGKTTSTRDICPELYE
ncbi:MAG: thioredoxin family protein [Litorivicinaceae bacterium]